jgi:hypothetical protein
MLMSWLVPKKIVDAAKVGGHADKSLSLTFMAAEKMNQIARRNQRPAWNDIPTISLRIPNWKTRLIFHFFLVLMTETTTHEAAVQ